MIESICKKCTTGIILNGGRWNIFSLKLGTKQRFPLPLLLFNGVFNLKQRKKKNRGEGRGEDNIFNATWDIYCILHYVKSHCLRNMNRCKKCSHLIGYIIHQRTWIFNFLTMCTRDWEAGVDSFLRNISGSRPSPGPPDIFHVLLGFLLKLEGEFLSLLSLLPTFSQ